MGKRLLILGDTYASLDIIKNAKELGITTIVTGLSKDTKARRLADEAYSVSTTDHEALKQLINKKQIDGVFCGPSEFNIRNLISLCEKTGMRCYTNMELWDRCANKDSFKKYCIRYGVDCPREYQISEEMTDQELSTIDFPIIVKPVDGCSSIGISVCRDKYSINEAFIKAQKASKSGRVIAEKYIDNNGEIFGVRYLVKNGEAYPYLMIDTYVADPINKTSLISAFTFTPSKYSKYYMKNMDQKVRNMIKGLGIKNGIVFFQSLPYNGKIYFHEMGYRLSGGMIYKLTEPLNGINDMQLMISYAVGNEFAEGIDLKTIDLKFDGNYGAQLMIPLSVGTIERIEGLEEAVNLDGVIDFLQYYHEGDTVDLSSIGTLQQLFGRFSIILDSEEKVYNLIDTIQRVLKIYDTDGSFMNNVIFDISRAKNKHKG